LQLLISFSWQYRFLICWNNPRKLHWYYYNLSSNWFIVGSISTKVDFQNLWSQNNPPAFILHRWQQQSVPCSSIQITFAISYHRFSVVKLMTYSVDVKPTCIYFPFKTEVDPCAKAAVVRNIIKSSLNPTITYLYITIIVICKVS
jgi:hypothetical protein